MPVLPRAIPHFSRGARERCVGRVVMVERMDRTGKLFAFPRPHRHELMDEGFQAERALTVFDLRVQMVLDSVWEGASQH